MIFLSYVGLCFCFIDLMYNMDVLQILSTAGRGQLRRAVNQFVVEAAEWRNVRSILLCIGCYMDSQLMVLPWLAFKAYDAPVNNIFVLQVPEVLLQQTRYHK